MASADCCSRRAVYTTRLRLSAQGLLPDLGCSPPWVRRSTFAAQALDLPMRTNEDGFVRVGSLADPHRPCVEFLSVTSQLWRECGRRRIGCRLNERIRRLPPHGRSPEPQLPSPSTLSIGDTVGILPSLRPSFSYRDLHPTSKTPCQAPQSDAREAGLRVDLSGRSRVPPPRDP